MDCLLNLLQQHLLQISSLADLGTCQRYVHSAAELPCVMTVSVTIPDIVISGEAAMISEKVAVRVTTPEVITLSESLLVIVAVVEVML